MVVKVDGATNRATTFVLSQADLPLIRRPVVRDLLQVSVFLSHRDLPPHRQSEPAPPAGSLHLNFDQFHLVRISIEDVHPDERKLNLEESS